MENTNNTKPIELQLFKRKSSGHYESKEYRIDHNYITNDWVVTRKSDKKRAFRTTLAKAKNFVNSIGVSDERNWDL